MKRLVLLGAGHAHLIVLRHFMHSPPEDTEVVLITPSKWQYYSGMIPGYMAGYYGIDQCRIEVPPLVKLVKGELILDTAIGLLPDQRQVKLAGGRVVEYDRLSIDIGSRSNLSPINGYAGQVLSIKPFGCFVEGWELLRQKVEAGQSQRIAVVGAGAAGVELALSTATIIESAKLMLVTGDNGLLPGFNTRVRQLAEHQLASQGVDLITGGARVRNGLLQSVEETSLDVDAVIAATGARPADCLANSGLALDAQGFILVDACHRSLSHPDVFAGGDTCSRNDELLKRSGVHAVRAGPVLARNLEASLRGMAAVPFYPRRHALYLIACGGGTAIGSYGPLSFSGAWVQRLKDWIDRRFISGFDLS